MRDTLVVGDLHGQYELVSWALSGPWNVVFMGDYLDSFDRPTNDQLFTLKEVLSAVGNEPSRVRALMGNHELSYLEPNMRASGYTVALASHLYPYLHIMREVLLPFTWVGGRLLSHAGVSQALLDSEGVSLYQYLDNGEYEQIGYSRGGSRPVGGLYWCDWFREFDPIPDLKQVVGHSGWRPLELQGKGILEKDGNFNVDCLGFTREFLLIKGDNTTEIIRPEGVPDVS